MALCAHFLFVTWFPSPRPLQVSCCRSYPWSWACQIHTLLDYVHLHLGSHSIFSWSLLFLLKQARGWNPLFPEHWGIFFLSQSWLYSAMATNSTWGQSLELNLTAYQIPTLTTESTSKFSRETERANCSAGSFKRNLNRKEESLKALSAGIHQKEKATTQVTSSDLLHTAWQTLSLK